jgi:hypothetical protein
MLVRIAWVIGFVVVLVSLNAWGGMYEWQFGGMTAYQLFPLFGLLAFGLMWTHYIVDAIRKCLNQSKEVLTDYFDMTSAAVLVLILAHPGLLVWQLWQDGHGLPPGSYKTYVGSALYGFVLMGVIALLGFLAYESRSFFKKPSLKQGIQYVSDVAMVLILIHGFRLGNVVDGWFGLVWLVYGISFLLALGYVRLDRSQKT